ncbi:MAG: DMT family transporter [Opitutaceae bacterium]
MISSAPSVRARAIVMLLLANLLWGLSFPLVKATSQLQARLLPEAGPWFLTVCTVAPRFLLAALVLLAFRPGILRGATAAEWRQGLILGLSGAAGMLLQTDALQYTAASTSAFLTQFYAVLIPAWLAWRVRRLPAPPVWLACGLVLTGVAVLGGVHPFAPGEIPLRFGRGEAETLLCSAFFMIQILALERAEFAGNRTLPITFVMFATEAVVFAALALALAPDAAALVRPWQSPAWLGLTAALTVFCTLGAFGLMTTFQPRITATEAGLLYCVEPVFAAALALFLPGLLSAWTGIAYADEQLTYGLLAGGALITAANVLLQLRPTR